METGSISRYILPISRTDFMKLGPVGPTLERTVRVFLEQHHDYAYTPKEIATTHFQADVLRSPNFPEIIRGALENLRARDLVLARFDEAPNSPDVYYAAP